MDTHTHTHTTHIRRFENRESLAHDLQFLANMPELCDTTFLVGEERQPICGVRAILAARSRSVCVCVCVRVCVCVSVVLCVCV